MIVGFIEIWLYRLYRYSVNSPVTDPRTFLDQSRSYSICITDRTAPISFDSIHADLHVDVIVAKATCTESETKQQKKEEGRNERCALELGGGSLFFMPATNLACHIGDVPRLISTRTYGEPFAPACRKRRTSITEHGSGYKMVSPYSRCTAA